MDAEQTWPTKEELAEAADNRNRKIVKVVPKGTSEYQAAWIPDEDGGNLLYKFFLFFPRSTKKLYLISLILLKIVKNKFFLSRKPRCMFGE